MNILDWIILVWLVGAVLSGIKEGFVYKIGELIGTIIALILASRLYTGFGWLFGWSAGGKIAAFVVLFLIISQLIAIAFKIVNKVLKIITKLPVIAQFNGLLGAAVGLVTNILILSLIVFFISKFSFGGWWHTLFATSSFVPILLTIGSAFAVFLPDALARVKSSF